MFYTPQGHGGEGAGGGPGPERGPVPGAERGGQAPVRGAGRGPGEHPAGCDEGEDLHGGRETPRSALCKSVV